MSNDDHSCLPFNLSSMGDSFEASVPGVADTGEPGIWIIFRGEELVIPAAGGSLIEGEMPGWAESYLSALQIGKLDGKTVRILSLHPDNRVPEGYLTEPLLMSFLYGRLPDNLVTLAGRAQQILGWEGRSTLCACCGGSTDRIAGTWGKRCRECGRESFPHIHPCTLVLVRRGDELLLIRKPEWPPGYYSIPSGFCDFGESLEECAKREVEEETGIRTTGLRYVGSQSWPFPAQLMVGFTAEYAGGEINVDRSELEDAGWFHKDSLPQTFSAKTIAGWMLETFGRSD